MISSGISLLAPSWKPKKLCVPWSVRHYRSNFIYRLQYRAFEFYSAYYFCFVTLPNWCFKLAIIFCFYVFFYALGLCENEVNGALNFVRTAHLLNRTERKRSHSWQQPLRGCWFSYHRFHRRYPSLFQLYTRDVSHTAEKYVKDLIPASEKNMERMAEAVPNWDDQALQHFLTNSPWDDQRIWGHA